MFRLLTIFLMTFSCLSFSQQFEDGELIGSKGFTYGAEARILNYNSDAYPDILAFPFIHVNDGQGNRKETIQFSDIENVETLQVGDFNNDELDDVVALLEDGKIEIFINSKKGLKALPQDTKLSYYRLEYSDIYVADINADQHLDILINRFGDYAMAYTGNGNGQFQKFKGFKKIFGNFGFVKSKDIDGDGKQEIISDYVIIENEERKIGIQIRTYENGNYLKKDSYMLNSGVDVFYIEDIDNDGDQDFIYSSEYVNGIYWNERDAEGHYSKIHKIETAENATNFYLIDMDGDKDLDIVKNTRVGPMDSSKNYWLENLGKGKFSKEKSITPKHKSAFMLVADLNADGKGDLIEVSVKNGYRISTGINNKMNFQYGEDWVINGGINDFDFMDVNNDGIKDIITASKHSLFYYEVSKKGKISEAIEIAQNEFFFNKIFLTDIDSDGLIDVFWWDEMTKDDRVGWYKNLGMGQFEPQEVNLTETRVANVNLIDFDGDNDMDI
ncbi:FG-GAP repeat domain-containing protein, partial [Psychroserpens sp.]|uniref:FG-GAP repeat domain-containing protein n=1 Tax=Psychroserpens sp. TaxID=2020870 RepID=UPI00385F7365